MDYVQRDRASARLANPHFIPVYRRLLASYGSSCANEVQVDQWKLARSLVYALLEYMGEDEIYARTTGETGPAARKLPDKADKFPEKVQKFPEKAQELPKGSSRRSKFEEYPHIDWRDLDNPVIRTADSIYTDRINLWSMLRQMEDGLYGAEAPASDVASYAEMSIRLQLCFAELRSLDSRGEFIGKHRFIAERDERQRLTELLRSDPLGYVRDMHNIELNISRYSSHLKSDKFSAERKVLEQANLDRHRQQLHLYSDILMEVINGKR